MKSDLDKINRSGNKFHIKITRSGDEYKIKRVFNIFRAEVVISTIILVCFIFFICGILLDTVQNEGSDIGLPRVLIPSLLMTLFFGALFLNIIMPYTEHVAVSKNKVWGQSKYKRFKYKAEDIQALSCERSEAKVRWGKYASGYRQVIVQFYLRSKDEEVLIFDFSGSRKHDEELEQLGDSILELLQIPLGQKPSTTSS